MKVNIQIFAFALIFYFTRQIEIYTMFMAFALIHELAHLVCGMLLGLKPKTLKIMPLGLCIEFKAELEDYSISIKKIIIAIAGPLTNLIIAVILYCINNVNVSNIIYCNLLIAIFNMLPVYPLDGGRILKDVLKINYGRKKSNEIMHVISNLVVILITAISSIAIYYYQNVAILFIIVYLWVLILKENREYKISSQAYRIIEMTKK